MIIVFEFNCLVKNYFKINEQKIMITFDRYILFSYFPCQFVVCLTKLFINSGKHAYTIELLFGGKVNIIFIFFLKELTVNHWKSFFGWLTLVLFVIYIIIWFRLSVCLYVCLYVCMYVCVSGCCSLIARELMDRFYKFKRQKFRFVRE